MSNVSVSGWKRWATRSSYFHASGVGGKSLERLSLSGELAGVVDVTTHELADCVGDVGVVAAQVIAPGAIDHANFWVGQVPDRYKTREFFQYNAQNLLMRTNTDEFRILGEEFAKRLNPAKGPVRTLIPLEGFSEHSKRRACNLGGDDKGPWKRSDDYRVFVDSLKSNLKSGSIEELPLHINDNAFADACVDAFLKIAKS